MGIIYAWRGYVCVSFPSFLIPFKWKYLEIRQRRQAVALQSLSRVPPSSSEAAELHTFYLKYGQQDQVNNSVEHESNTATERVWMGDTVLEKCMLMFPQERKYVHYFIAFSVPKFITNQKIFGGHLMRLAYEVI